MHRRTLLAVGGIVIAKLFGLEAWGGGAQETLTNDGVVALVKAGLSPLTVITAIKSSTTRFDVSAKSLIELKSSGVPDEVIRAIVEAAATRPTMTSAAKPPVERLYVVRASAAGELDREPIQPTGARQRFAVGLFGAGMQVAIAGKNASVQLTDAKPTFVLQLTDDNDTPARYVLTRLGPSDEGQGRRIDLDQAIRFHTEKIGPREYKVTPNSSLRRGEYCFYRADQVKDPFPGQGGAFDVFDFSVVEARRK